MNSRKAFLTGLTVVLTTVLAFYSKMTPDTALVFAAAIGSLNYALRNSG